MRLIDADKFEEFLWNNMDFMVPKVEPDDTTEAYNKGLNDGRNEVWELADKLNNMPMQDIIDIYGFDVDRCSVYSKITPQEALAKLEAYEKEQAEIKVGDVVKNYGEGEYIVIATADEMPQGQPLLRNLANNGVEFASNKDLTKTGKHIDIQSVLQQIGGGSDA